MFLNAVILILQEILEASLLISILLALNVTLWRTGSGGVRADNSWVWAALAWGGGGALLYGWLMPVTAVWFDYGGYEVINALLQAGIICCLVLLCHLRPSAQDATPASGAVTRICMVAVVALGIVREGSEIILYLQGIMSQRENITPVLLGGVMATGIGGSSGFLLYASFTGGMRAQRALRVVVLLLALFGGNMAAQAVALLTQADWLPYTVEVWNSSSLLPEYSISGQLLYALVGYEANPSLLQLAAYLGTAAGIVCSPLFMDAWFTSTATAGSENT